MQNTCNLIFRILFTFLIYNSSQCFLLIPLKTADNQRFFGVFRGNLKETLERKQIITPIIDEIFKKKSHSNVKQHDDTQKNYNLWIAVNYS